MLYYSLQGWIIDLLSLISVEFLQVQGKLVKLRDTFFADGYSSFSSLRFVYTTTSIFNSGICCSGPEQRLWLVFVCETCSNQTQRQGTFAEVSLLSFVKFVFISSFLNAPLVNSYLKFMAEFFSTNKKVFTTPIIGGISSLSSLKRD